MIDLQSENSQPVNAFLVGLSDLRELRGLVETLGLVPQSEVLLSEFDPHPRYLVGTGKAEEIAGEAEEAGADCIIFDFELSPTHQRNWEKLAKIPVFDRHEVILRIFAQRARTKEAVLQVELARLEYSLPRLAHSYGDMARQRGGSYGSKGAGETKLELDRRGVEERMSKIRRELDKVVKERQTMRKKRDKIPLPSCALVGYTNAGKSSLLNALTGAAVYVEDQLFATLDPTTRRLSLAQGAGILLTDTVGFISNLPHSLVNAFKSTLEETVDADLLLLVLDASDPNVFSQYSTVMAVLDEIGADTEKALILLNKTDLECSPLLLGRLKEEFPEAIPVSAKTKAGFDSLFERISTALLGSPRSYRIPLENQALVAQVHRSGTVLKEEWLDDCIMLEARISGKTLALLEPFLV